ncbi:MAG: hypothetical protein LBV03_02835 [Fusobacteriales bacterium]|jgi:hypothetical protein|nr:hypothetical protein [Fusobacteriales bacterium]
MKMTTSEWHSSIIVLFRCIQNEKADSICMQEGLTCLCEKDIYHLLAWCHIINSQAITNVIFDMFSFDSSFYFIIQGSTVVQKNEYLSNCLSCDKRLGSHPSKPTYYFFSNENSLRNTDPYRQDSEYLVAISLKYHLNLSSEAWKEELVLLDYKFLIAIAKFIFRKSAKNDYFISKADIRFFTSVLDKFKNMVNTTVDLTEDDKPTKENYKQYFFDLLQYTHDRFLEKALKKVMMLAETRIESLNDNIWKSVLLIQDIIVFYTNHNKKQAKESMEMFLRNSIIFQEPAKKKRRI